MAVIGMIAVLFLLWKIAYKKGFSKGVDIVKETGTEKPKTIKKGEADDDAVIIERGGKRYVMVEVE